MGPVELAAAAAATIAAMSRRRRTFQPPHFALRKAIDAHARIGVEGTPAELAELAREQEASGKQHKSPRDYRRGSGGKFA